MEKTVTVYGVSLSRSSAEFTVDVLKEGGFMNSDVSVLFSSKSNTKEFAEENSTGTIDPKGSSAATGAAMGGVFGWLIGLGIIAFPEGVPFVAAGPLMTALAGIGVGGALGSLASGLVNIGLPEEAAKVYEARLKEGCVLLAVNTETKESAEKVAKIFENTGEENVRIIGPEDPESGLERNQVQ
jgi:hypothetical protein